MSETGDADEGEGASSEWLMAVRIWLARLAASAARRSPDP